jgi:hypothetical protein
MYDLEHGKNYNTGYYHENYCIIRTISPGFGIMKRWKKSHVLFPRCLGYKTALPILEITVKIYSRQGEKITC